MAYTVKITSTKPSNVTWFSASPAASGIPFFSFEDRWKSLNPQKLLTVEIVKPSSNTVIKTLTFADQVAYYDFLADKDNSPEITTKREYNLANGITSQREFI